jgi:hypothetical protein
MLNSKYLGVISYIQFFDFYNMYLVNISQLIRHFYAVLGQFCQKVRQILYAILMYSIRNSILCLIFIKEMYGKKPFHIMMY